ncbi:IS3 family transposase [Limosilactobacillus fermentum]|uniref:IS3 family transposase n=1 Tax=Limosilactobacillus fermentum TaxID=1613 RepID=UPI0021A7687E|nr:IS3 family transposase [Limosilactobacillus fermentum]
MFPELSIIVIDPQSLQNAGPKMRTLKQRILRIFAEFKQRYGVMKIHHELNLELQPLQRRCSPRRISRFMKELDIYSVTVNN